MRQEVFSCGVIYAKRRETEFVEAFVYKDIFVHFPHDCTLLLWAQLIQTGFMLFILRGPHLFFSVLFRAHYKVTSARRATTHQLHSFAIELVNSNS